MSKILDAIRAERVKKLDRQFVGAEAHAKNAIALGEVAKRTRSSKPEVIEEVHLTEMYYSMVARYSGKRNFTNYTPSKKRDAIWKRIIARVHEAGVGAETFLKAQFVFFDAAFGCPPSLPSLTTEKAVKRAQEFTGKAGNVVASSTSYTTEKAAVLQHTDKFIRDICKVQKISREQFYITFVITGEISIPKVFLDIDPVWKAVSNATPNDK
jgi:hypothetical protein